MPLTRTEAADTIKSIIQGSTRSFINMPQQYVGYAAAAGFYVTTSWPGDNPASFLPSSNARGPEMVDSIQRYVAMAAKTVTFQFTCSGIFNLTESPDMLNDGAALLARESAKVRPGQVEQFRVYYPNSNGAGGGQVYNAIRSFRKISGPGSVQVNGGQVTLSQSAPAFEYASTTYEFTIDNLATIARAAVVFAGFDDWTCVLINGRMVDVYNGYLIKMGLQHQATDFSFDGDNVYLGALGSMPVEQQIVLPLPYFMQANLNDNVKGHMRNGVNTLELRYANYTSISYCEAKIEIVEMSGAGAGAPINPDAPGYAAVLSGNASYSALTNLLNNLGSKLHSNMLNSVFHVTYCHTNCHNNCHSSQ